jgi:hypothetical protein
MGRQSNSPPPKSAHKLDYVPTLTMGIASTGCEGTVGLTIRMRSPSLFAAAILYYTISFIADVPITSALYVLRAPVNRIRFTTNGPCP